MTEQQLKTLFLRQRQGCSLSIVKQMAIRRIVAWREYWQGLGQDVYVSLGGKDSHALLHLCRTVYPDIKGVFVDTGLEYPEVRELNTRTPNVIVLKPKMNFKQVIEKYGWPVISKKTAQYLHEIQNPTEKNRNTVKLRTTGYRTNGTHSPMAKISDKWLYLKDAPFKISDACCHVMKVNPLRSFAKESGLVPIIGTTSDESQTRERGFLKYGCLAFSQKYPIATPIIFWTEQHVLQYLRQNNIEVAACYGEQIEKDGAWRYSKCQRTGCMFCGFGAHLEDSPNRFERMELTHPNQHRYCMDQLGLKLVLQHCGIPYRNEQGRLFA